jgi:phosphoserine aminotransferase
MLNFYPGPSKLYPSIEKHLIDAYKCGILSKNHRSADFMELLEQTTHLLKTKLNIPSDYAVFYISSATEAWEIIAQSLIKESSLHLYNGSFGEKWFNYTKKLNPNTKQCQFGLNEILPTDKITPSELICITQNETSNGTSVNNITLKKIRDSYQSSLIAVDLTSSLGGVKFNFEDADIWFASVQKCMGLPSGLGILICSPNAVKRAYELNFNLHYNSIIANYEQMKVSQTTHTPNILGIYLLKNILTEIENITEIEKRTKNNLSYLQNELAKIPFLAFLTNNSQILSETVIALKIDENHIEKLKKHLLQNNIIIGNGYGEWKKNTIRIANFPQIEFSEFEQLIAILNRFEY